MTARPPFQLLPDLSDDEFAQLKADIAERGIFVPIEYDEAGNVLDGHHRLRICAELGIERWPSLVRSGFADDAAKRSHARALNLARRHLNQAQRRALIEDQLRDTPAQSNNSIAQALGVSDTTVGSVRADLETGSQIGNLETIKGKDGKNYPAKRAKLKSKFHDGAGPPRGTAFTGNNEWFTPPAFVDRARDAMRGIDLDPASHPHAQQWIAAAEYFTAENDGLAHDWRGRVWMNPPYASALISLFVEKLVAEYRKGRVSEAVMLTHNNTDTSWFHEAAGAATAFCFPKGRIGFIDTLGARNSPTQGQVFCYFGPEPRRFFDAFVGVGFLGAHVDG
jgi:phage N-6-adenine-methyltransferase